MEFLFYFNYNHVHLIKKVQIVKTERTVVKGVVNKTRGDLHKKNVFQDQQCRVFKSDKVLVQTCIRTFANLCFCTEVFFLIEKNLVILHVIPNIC